MNTKKVKYNVRFYGTNESGINIKEIDIVPLRENKTAFESPKPKYAETFCNAIKEAEKVRTKEVY